MISVVIRSLFIAAILFVLFLSYYIKIHDYMLIVVISLATAWWMVKFHHSDDSGIKWVGFEFVTMVMFWTVTKQHRRQWHNPVLWVSVTVLLFVYVAAFWLVLRKFKEPGPVWVIAFALAEFIPISIALEWAIANFGKCKRAKRVSQRA